MSENVYDNDMTDRDIFMQQTPIVYQKWASVTSIHIILISASGQRLRDICS